MTVRAIAIALAAAAGFAAAAPAHAIEYPWCAQYGRFGDGGRNCGFVSYGQCMATVSGIGGFCERNSFYKGREPAKRRRHVESR
jgi:uncharacterized protein DUF3551